MVDWKLSPNENIRLNQRHFCISRRVIDQDSDEALYYVRIDELSDDKDSAPSYDFKVFDKKKLESMWPDEEVGFEGTAATPETVQFSKEDL